MFGSNDAPIEKCGYVSRLIPIYDPRVGMIVFRWISVRRGGFLRNDSHAAS